MGVWYRKETQMTNLKGLVCEVFPFTFLIIVEEYPHTVPVSSTVNPFATDTSTCQGKAQVLPVNDCSILLSVPGSHVCERACTTPDHWK